MTRTLALLGALAVLGATPASAQDYSPQSRAPAPAVKTETVSLWPNGAPGSEKRRGEAEQAQDYWVKNVHNPTLTVFRPDPRHTNGAAVIVIPGGGHRILVWTTEGIATAQPMARLGVTTFVLKYRLAREEGSTYSIERDAAADVRRAIRWVRAHAAQYGVDPHRVGVMGYSAGGELVTLVSDNPGPDTARAPDPLDRGDARPDFQILVFPGPLGVPATAVKGAPPAFLTAGSLDPCCGTPTLRLYEQLRDAGVPAELHMYAHADHAFNLGETSTLLSVAHWPDRLADWLADGGWLDATSQRSAVLQPPVVPPRRP
jgi:acetyl esterase/lipase